MDIIAFSPTAIPAISMGLGLVIFYLSPLMRWTRLYGTTWIVIIALVGGFMAYGTRLGHSAIVQLNTELEEQSWVSGRGRFTTFLRITLPLLFPALVAGWIWIAAKASSALTIPLILETGNNQVLAVRLYEIWYQFTDLSYASAIGVILLVVLVGFAFIGRRIIARGFSGD